MEIVSFTSSTSALWSKHFGSAVGLECIGVKPTNQSNAVWVGWEMVSMFKSADLSVLTVWRLINITMVHMNGWINSEILNSCRYSKFSDGPDSVCRWFPIKIHRYELHRIKITDDTNFKLFYVYHTSKFSLRKKLSHSKTHSNLSNWNSVFTLLFLGEFFNHVSNTYV